MDNESQEALLQRFRAYLEDGSARDTHELTSNTPDLFSLLAEMSALKSEVKIESRQFKTALEQFRELFEVLQEDKTRLERQLVQLQSQVQAQQDEREGVLLAELIELRDRLSAGYVQAQRYMPGWLARRGGAGDFVKGMSQGMAMNLERLDGILVRRDVHKIDTLGKPFDPYTMQASDISYTKRRPEGEVLEELRAGYWHGERLLRLAEVVVNKQLTSETSTS